MSTQSKTVLITGASQGIGKACAMLAAEKGYQVVVNYAHQRQLAENVVRSIKDLGGDALAIQADISDETAVLRMMDQIHDQFGYLDALVNNAAIIESQMKVQDMSAARLQKVFAVNVLGSMLCAREAVRSMALSAGGQGGAIVQISSIAARLGSPFEYVDYAATKGAVESFVIGLSKEVAAEGIRVNAVRPGLVYTDIHAKAGEPGRVKRLESGIPMLRGGQPEEIAQSVLWLLSDKASYVTGAILDVSGGR
ncbi:MAG: SDR family oxidoreductase [Chitinophagales bacterium]|nr:SDR family oxidoreductase [Chitinophagales bacterium]